MATGGTTGTVAAIGAAALVRGYALAGVAVTAAEDADAARDAWQALDPAVAVVIVSPAVAAALGDAVHSGDRMVAVLPGPDRWQAAS